MANSFIPGIPQSNPQQMQQIDEARRRQQQLQMQQQLQQQSQPMAQPFMTMQPFSGPQQQIPQPFRPQGFSQQPQFNPQFHPQFNPMNNPWEQP